MSIGSLTELAMTIGTTVTPYTLTLTAFHNVYLQQQLENLALTMLSWVILRSDTVFQLKIQGMIYRGAGSRRGKSSG